MQRNSPKNIRHSMIISKIYSNPITSKTLGIYSYAKNSNRLFNSSFNFAESTLKWASAPVVRRLDNYAFLIESQLAKFTETFYLRTRNITEIYHSTKFLLDISSSLASNSLYFAKGQLEKFSVQELYSESQRLSAKLNNREAIVHFVEEDLVKEIRSMSNLVIHFLDDIRSRAETEDHQAIGRIVSIIESGLNSVLDVLPAVAITLPEITITPATPIKRARKESAQSDDALPNVPSTQMEMEMEMETEMEIQVEEAEIEPLLTQSEVSGNVTVITPAELKEEEELAVASNSDSESSQDDDDDDVVEIEIDSTESFPSLPQLEKAPKKSYASMIKKKQSKKQSIPTVIDLSSLNHELQFARRPIAAKPIAKEEVVEEKLVEEIHEKPDEKSVASSVEEHQFTYSDAVQSHRVHRITAAKPDSQWHEYHSRHHPIAQTEPHRPSVSNPFELLSSIPNEVSEFSTVAEEAASLPTSHHHLRHHSNRWERAVIPEATNKAVDHHHNHHRHVAHAAKQVTSSITTLADSNPFAAFREDLDIQEAKEEADLLEARMALLAQLETERVEAALRLRATKKLESAERHRRVHEIANAEKRERLERQEEKKHVIMLEEIERKERFTAYITALLHKREMEKMEEAKSSIEMQVLAEIEQVESQVAAALELDNNRTMAIELEEAERARRIDESNITNDISVLERKVSLNRVIREEEKERKARVAEYAIKQSGELQTATGSPLM